MSTRVVSLIILGAALGMGSMSASADNPQAADGAQKPATPTEAPTSTDKPATANATDKPKVDEAEQEHELRSMGYKPEIRKGEKWYCRREQILGSHFDKKSCNTAAEILAQRQAAQDAVRTMQDNRPQINK